MCVCIHVGVCVGHCTLELNRGSSDAEAALDVVCLHHKCHCN